MSELPKLEKILFDTKEYELISRNKKGHKFRKFEFVITEDNYKSQLTLWGKYKDNPELFLEDYPQYKNEYEYNKEEFSENKTLRYPELAYIDWHNNKLFNKLFKEGIV